MSLPNQELNFVFQLVAFVSVVPIVVVKTTELRRTSLGDIFLYRCGSFIRHVRAGRLVDFRSTFDKGRVVGESRLISIAFGAFILRSCGLIARPLSTIPAIFVLVAIAVAIGFL